MGRWRVMVGEVRPVRHRENRKVSSKDGRTDDSSSQQITQQGVRSYQMVRKR